VTSTRTEQSNLTQQCTVKKISVTLQKLIKINHLNGALED